MNRVARPTLRSARDLAAAGLVRRDEVPALDLVGARYTIAVTPAMADLIDHTADDDPIARQFVPDGAELATDPQERADPIGDAAHEVTPGLIHRYPDRVLLKLVATCAVYCRFCFRREAVGGGAGNLGKDDVASALAYIRATPAIWEVILSGGDPLVASAARLSALVNDLAAIDHVRVVRAHTRLPLVAPEQVTVELARALATRGVTTWLALHINHRRELTTSARSAIDRLADAGIHLVSQTVLLRGVNDEADTLADLMRGLVEAGVKPYYLHHPDLAPGTGHFRLSIEEGQRLVAALRARMSGLCQPAYVLDMPDGTGKVPIARSHVEGAGKTLTVRDLQGERHAYTAWRRGR